MTSPDLRHLSVTYSSKERGLDNLRQDVDINCCIALKKT